MCKHFEMIVNFNYHIDQKLAAEWKTVTLCIFANR